MLTDINEIDLAWLAGLLEGEGSFTLQQPARLDGSLRIRISISIQMTDLDILEKVANIVGYGKVLSAKRQAGHHKNTWRWQISSYAIVEELMIKLLPYMGQRRKNQIIRCLDA